jgi:hypothetical protein
MLRIHPAAIKVVLSEDWITGKATVTEVALTEPNINTRQTTEKSKYLLKLDLSIALFTSRQYYVPFSALMKETQLRMNASISGLWKIVLESNSFPNLNPGIIMYPQSTTYFRRSENVWKYGIEGDGGCGGLDRIARTVDPNPLD